MELIRRHHHFRADLIEPTDRVARCERYVIDALLTTSLPDSERESSIAWELKHQAGITQMARLLGRKRGLPLDVCSVGALFHDIYVILHGLYSDHAHLGAPIAVQVVSEIGGFSPEEKEQIHRIVYHHSDKHIPSGNALEEFGKDADILDIFLYPGPFGEYLLTKPLPRFVHYLNRAATVWTELGLPNDPRFDLLAGYRDPWFQKLATFSPKFLSRLIEAVFALSHLPKEYGACPPALCLLTEKAVDGNSVSFYGNRGSWGQYLDRKLTDAIAASTGSEIQLLKALITARREARASQRTASVSGTSAAVMAAVLGGDKAVVFWPLADLYETVELGRGEARLAELGIEKP